jgi:hypothetical protein
VLAKDAWISLSVVAIDQCNHEEEDHHMLVVV